jgi:hypothetical protein
LREELPYDEFIFWTNYFKKYPIGWREDMRAFKIMKSNGSKITLEQAFPNLAEMSSARTPVESLKGSMLHKKLLSAKGGDKLDFL